MVDFLRKKEEKLTFVLLENQRTQKDVGEMIKIGRRGSLSGSIEIFGTQGHIAYPHLSNNPISAMIKVCGDLKKNRLIMEIKVFNHQILEFTSIDVDNKAHNVIPSSIKAQFNIRYNTFHTARSLRKENPFNDIKKICKIKNVNLKLFIGSGEAFITKPGKSISNGKK